jgi:hypothetical protein
VIIDCDRCEMRDIACDDCVMSVLLNAPTEAIDAETVSALRVLGDRGLTPRLQLRLPPAAAG